MLRKIILCLVLVLLTAGCSQTIPSANPTADPTETINQDELDLSTAAILESSVYLPLPEGFHALSDDYVGTWMRVSPSYPTDPSNINVSVSEPEGVRDRWEAAPEQYLQDLEDIFGDEGEPVLLSLDRVELNGREALEAEYTARLDNQPIHALQYMILTDRAYTFTFTDYADGLWLESFRQCADAIRILEPGQTMEPDTTGLTAYSLGPELRIWAEAGLRTAQELNLTGVDGLFGEQVSILASTMEKSLHPGLSLAQYREHVWDDYELPLHQTSIYGDEWCGYFRQDEDGSSYYCFLSVTETPNNFYIIQMICPRDARTHYGDRFRLWMATVTPVIQ